MNSLKIRSLKSISFLMLIGLFINACSDDNAPDSIFINGNVLTVDINDSVQEAVAVKDGVIIQIGKTKDLLNSANENTKIIDLNQKTLIPGFIASHEHPTLKAVFSTTVDLSGFTFKSSKPMWESLRKRVKNTNKGEWIFAMGLDPILIPDLVTPTKAFLDKIAPDNPLFIVSQTMHSFWANTQAFKASGITNQTPDPGQGSYYGKDKNGELNGFVSESTAAAPFIEELKSPFAVVERYQNTLDELLKSGFTSVASLGFNMPPFLAKYASSNNFRPRIRQFIYLSPEELEYLPDTPNNGDDYYKIMGIKLWHDGSPYTGTMSLVQPYLYNSLTQKMGIKENHKGESRLSDEKFEKTIREFNESGWQVAVHSQGDQSNIDSLKSFKSQLSDQGKDLRHRLEHCLLIPKEVLGEFKALGLTPSFHINHIYYYGDALSSSIIGAERAQKILPVKTAFDYGLHPTLHADSPMFPTDAFSLMKTAITRKTKSGQVLAADQAISVQQALRTMTINGAWQLHMENKIGSIEIGKLADFTLINENLYEYSVDLWSNIKVEQVWLAGKVSL